jgi:23S rRNA maturation mini-RNase III
MATLRQKLHLDVEPWLQLPDELLAIAFRPASVRISELEKDRLTELYTSYNLERFEYIGDAVLELAVSDILFDEIQDGPGKLSQLRQELVRNTTLFCLMEHRGLCQFIEETEELRIKTCADVFEAIIGVLYFYLNYIYTEEVQINSEIRLYLQKWWYTEEVLDRLCRGELLDQYVIDGKTVRECGNDYVLETRMRTASIVELEAMTAKLPHSIRKLWRSKDKKWFATYSKSFTAGKDLYLLLQKLYSDLHYNLARNTFLAGDDVAIRELNFKTRKLVVYETVTASTIDEAKERAAFEVLARLL